MNTGPSRTDRVKGLFAELVLIAYTSLSQYLPPPCEIISDLVGRIIDLNSFLMTPPARRKSRTHETDSGRHLRRSLVRSLASPRLVQTNFSSTRPSDLSRPRDGLMERGKTPRKTNDPVESGMNHRLGLVAVLLLPAAINSSSSARYYSERPTDWSAAD